MKKESNTVVRLSLLAVCIFINYFCIKYTVQIQDEIRPHSSLVILQNLPSLLAAIGSTFLLACFKKSTSKYTATIVISFFSNIFNEFYRFYAKDIPIDIYDIVAICIGIFISIVLYKSLHLLFTRLSLKIHSSFI